jgi:nitroreductase
MGTELIKSRRSVRKYKIDPVDVKIIDDILDCGRLAPSAMNIQPWLIGAVTDRRILGDLASLTDHGKFIADCAVCFAVFCDKAQKYYLEDGAAAAMNIIFASWSHGIGTCWIAGDKKQYGDSIRRLLNVPEKYSLVALVPGGYPDEYPSAKNKKPARDVSFRNSYQ